MTGQQVHDLLVFLDAIANNPNLDVPTRRQAVVLSMMIMQLRGRLTYVAGDPDVKGYS